MKSKSTNYDHIQCDQKYSTFFLILGDLERNITRSIGTNRLSNYISKRVPFRCKTGNNNN